MNKTETELDQCQDRCKVFKILKCKLNQNCTAIYEMLKRIYILNNCSIIAGFTFKYILVCYMHPVVGRYMKLP